MEEVTVAGQGAKLATGWLELTVSTAGAAKSITSEIVPAGVKAGDAGGSNIGSSMIGALKKFAGPIAAALSIGAVIKGAKDSMDAFTALGGSVGLLQRIAGGTKEQVSGLAGAMQLAGVNTDKTQGVLTIFSRNLGNASADGVKASAMTAALGTGFLDAAGNVKPLSDILPGLADKFRSMPDGAQKTALAMQLFGRSGTEMLPFLNKGSAGIAELTAQAKSSGLVIDDVAGRIMLNAKQSTRDFGAATQGLSATFGGDLLPIVEAVRNVYRSALMPVIQAATTFLQEHRAEFLKVGDTIDKFAGIIGGKVSSALATIGPMFKGAFSAFAPVIAQLGPMFAQLGPIFSGIVPQLFALGNAVSPVQILFKALVPVLPQLVGLIGNLVATLGGALGKALAVILPVLLKVAETLGGTLTKVITQLLPVLVSLITLGVKIFAKELITLAPVIAKIAGVLGDVLLAVLNGLAPILPIIAKTFGDVLQALVPLIPPVLDLVVAVLGLIVPLMKLIGPILGPLIGLFVAILKPILQLISPLVSLLVPVLQFLVTVLAAIVTGIVNVITWFVNLITGSKNMQQAVGVVVGAVGGFFADMWRNVTGFFSNGISGIIRFFTNLPNSIRAAIGNMGGMLVNAGRDLIQGLINGAGSLLRNIGSFFLNLLPSWIVGPFKAAMGIHSPSSVFAGFGDDTINGYINQIVTRSDDVGTAVGALANKATLAMAPPLAGLNSALNATGISAQAQTPVAPNVAVYLDGELVRPIAVDVFNNADAQGGDTIRRRRRPAA